MVPSFSLKGRKIFQENRTERADGGGRKTMEYTLITGACGGLGGAFTELLAERGEALYLTGRSYERLQALAERIGRAHEVPVKFAPCDLTDPADRVDFFANCDREGIRFRRLVYVAGVDTQSAFEKYDEHKLIFQSRVNFEGAVSFVRGVLARADLDGSTEILAVGSMSASTPMPYFALYSATKKGLEYFLSAIRTELKGRAKVTCVLPGGIPTRDDIKENIAAHGFWGKISAKSPHEVAAASLKAVERNKRVKVIGFWNKVIKLATDLAPMPVKLRFIAKRWSLTEKDHFSS